jgi:Domain of unknown function (DUF1996)
MRRWLVLLSALTVAGVALTAGSAASGGSQRDRGNFVVPGRNYFAVLCNFSHRNDDDPIVFPGMAGLSHNHTFFGNRTTSASSTPESLRAARSTTCSTRYDTAAYWVPTLRVSGQAVEPRGATVYYIRRTRGRVRAFPFGLKMIAGDATARSAQSLDVTSWNCARSRQEPSSAVPTCESGRLRSLLLVVNFPNCWDGTRLDSANHKLHMAYSTNASCPTTHPVAVPALRLVIRYPVTGGQTTDLSSVGQFSAHADFVNAWNQRVLTRLVARYLNRGR